MSKIAFSQRNVVKALQYFPNYYFVIDIYSNSHYKDKEEGRREKHRAKLNRKSPKIKRAY